MRAVSVLMGGFACATATLVSVSAFAGCSGASAPIALQTFDAAPAAWLEANKGRGDIGAKAQALAAAAVNSSDPAFGKNLASVLGTASGDDGAAIGTALGSLGKTCSDPKDPGDRADKQYIAENIERNLLTNAAANTAYGQQGGPETAATSASASGGGAAGGSGSGSGTGSTGDGLPTGGTNSGIIPDGTSATANAIGTLEGGSVGAVGGSSFSTADLGTSTGTGSIGSGSGSGTGTTTISCTGVLVAICGNGSINGNITLGVFTTSGSTISNSQMIVQ